MSVYLYKHVGQLWWKKNGKVDLGMFICIFKHVSLLSFLLAITMCGFRYQNKLYFFITQHTGTSVFIFPMLLKITIKISFHVVVATLYVRFAPRNNALQWRDFGDAQIAESTSQKCRLIKHNFSTCKHRIYFLDRSTCTNKCSNMLQTIFIFVTKVSST